MAESRPGEDIEQRLEHEAADMDERLDKLGEHLEDAQAKAQDRRKEADPESVTGDWEDTEPGRPGGDDPEGAVEDERREAGDN
jgi:hypothetical protein